MSLNPFRPELTVHLALSPEGAVRVVYHRADLGMLESLTPQPRRLTDIGTDLRYPDRRAKRRGVAAIHALLDENDENQFDAAVRGELGQRIGRLLFELLFPEEALWRKLFAGLFSLGDQRLANPSLHPVRLRVWTEDPELLSLPWRMTLWQSEWLLNSGWTFEVVKTPRSDGLLALRSPCKLLVVAPRYPGQTTPGTAHHFADLRDYLYRLSPLRTQPEFFRRAETRAELLSAISGMGPEIVYFYGHGDLRNGQLALLLDNPGNNESDPLGMADFKRMLAVRYPRIVFLNGCLTGAAGWQAAGHHLCPQVPLVFGNRTVIFSNYAGRIARRWFERVLGNGVDPVLALHQLDPKYSQWDYHWITHVVHSHYRTCTIDGQPMATEDEFGALRLDRDEPRALVARHAGELLHSSRRRVEALVAFAESDNLIESFAHQAVDELEHSKLARVYYEVIKFPLLSKAHAGARADKTKVPERALSLKELLQAELLLQLEAEGSETLSQLLRRRYVEEGAGPQIVLLEFGVFGRRQGLISPPVPLREWLLFCQDILAQACPDGLRIIAYVGIEADVSKHGDIESQMDNYRVQLTTEKFRCSVLSVLTRVKAGHLSDYLQNHSNCPSGYIQEASQRIFRKTAGVYAPTVTEIRKGQVGGWASLLDALRQEQNAVPLGNEDLEL